MASAYTVVAVLTSLMAMFSGSMKIRHDPRVTSIIHEMVGVPLKFFPYLAACEFAGALGLLVGIVWPALGVAAAAGLSFYFVGAVVGHIRVSDLKGVGPAAFMLCISGACFVLRVRSM
jgi:sorbitol-specific phosphotransferase system component IIC